MVGLILIGGLGARLRPFTLETPKPLLPVLNRPFIDYQIDYLRRHGARDVILCTSYRASAFRRALARRAGMRLRFAHEPRPLGTGGALRNAAPLLGNAPRLVVLNGDVLNSTDLRQLAAFHARRRAELTIGLTRVKDPSHYGLVLCDHSGRVTAFVEKPSLDETTTDAINAGVYLFERALIDGIPPGRPYSLERELFPSLLRRGRKVFGFPSSGYWMDIGTIERYLQIHIDLLSARGPRAKGLRTVATADGGRALLGPGSRVAPGALWGHVCVGARCRIGLGARLQDCVVHDGATIGEGARLERCVVGARCRVGRQAAVTGRALAAGSSIGAYSAL